MTSPSKRSFDTVLVDLDNTVYDYEEAGKLAREQMASWVEVNARATREIVEETYSDIIREAAGFIFKSGYEMRRHRFEILALRLKANFDAEHLSRLFGDWLLGAVHPYPGALDALSTLSRFYRLLIVSEGYSDIQSSIMQKLGIGDLDLFASFQSGTRKLDGSTYAYLLSSLGLKPASTVMIGDNWQNDVIAPAQHLIHTVWIAHGRNIPDNAPFRFVGYADELSTVPTLLAVRQQAIQ